jgi:hypothetical protein
MHIIENELEKCMWPNTDIYSPVKHVPTTLMQCLFVIKSSVLLFRTIAIDNAVLQ